MMIQRSANQNVTSREELGLPHPAAAPGTLCWRPDLQLRRERQSGQSLISTGQRPGPSERL